MLAEADSGATMPSPITYYKLDCIDSETLYSLQSHFNDLPLDPYIEDYYRYRRFSRFSVSNGLVKQMPHSAFRQSAEYNKILGNVVRNYPDLDSSLIEKKSFSSLLIKFSNECNMDNSHHDIGVHQIRVTCTTHSPGNPAPEGIHRDGVETIGILCVKRLRIRGGMTSLFFSPEKSPCFQSKISPGELLIINDRQLLHYTSPINPMFSKQGLRDVFVLTFPSLPR
jgi:hypothetical protein